MGVIRLPEAPSLVKVENEHVTYADYVFDDSDEEELNVAVQCDKHGASSVNRKPKKRRDRRFVLAQQEDDGKRGKNMGSRKTRFLATLADPDDVCDDFTDLLPRTISAFSRLFIEQEKMQAWNAFIEQEEAQQLAFLQSANTSREDGADEKTGKYTLGGKGGKVTGKRKNVLDNVGRSSRHPAYSAEACFRRMSRRYQSLFMERYLPWHFIDQSERDLIDFFLTCPEGIWVGVHPNAMHRLLLHGVCEYLSLQSSSSSNRTDSKCVDDVRVTEVRNHRPFFIAPYHNLITYLSALRRARNRPPIEL